MDTKQLPRHYAQNPDRPAGFTYSFTDGEGRQIQGFITFAWLLGGPKYIGIPAATAAMFERAEAYGEIPPGIEIRKAEGDA